MAEIIITPDHDSIELSIPESYVGKKVKISYTIEETHDDMLVEPKKPSQYRGTLSMERVDGYLNHIQQSRDEWQKRI